MHAGLVTSQTILLGLCVIVKNADIPVLPVLFISQATRQDLQSCVEESWEEHAQTVEDLLRYQLAEHRLVRVSLQSDKNFITAVTVQRIQSILENILFQLVLKASDGKFQATKSLLMELTNNSNIT